VVDETPSAQGVSNADPLLDVHVRDDAAHQFRLQSRFPQFGYRARNFGPHKVQTLQPIPEIRHTA